MAIPILMYHQVDAPAPRGSPLRGLIVSPAAFRRQMTMLKVLGYRGLSMGALQPYLRGEKQGKVVGITLDDGYLNNLRHALPALQEFGFTATCYVVANAIGGSNAWDHAKGIAPKPLMDVAQLRQWVAGGQELGAHGCDHVDLRSLSASQAQQQIGDCRQTIEDACGARVRHFCYPYGSYAPEHVGMVAQAGFDTATTTRRGRGFATVNTSARAPATHLLELPRVPVWGATTLPALWLKIATTYEDRKGARG